MTRASLIFLFAIGVGLLQPATPVLVYMTRTATFIDLFCENKDRPEKECHGFCHLSRMADEAQEETTASVLIANAFVAAVLPPTPIDLAQSASEQRWSTPLARDIPLMLERSIFHPPRA
jgi:hypothetical protein